MCLASHKNRASTNLQACWAVPLMWNTSAKPTQRLTEEVSTVDNLSPCSLCPPDRPTTQLPAESEMPTCLCTSHLTFKSWQTLKKRLPACLVMVWIPAIKKFSVKGSLLPCCPAAHSIRPCVTTGLYEYAGSIAFCYIFIVYHYTLFHYECTTSYKVSPSFDVNTRILQHYPIPAFSD